jgi:branched-chain amino acid transport system permease protein
MMVGVLLSYFCLVEWHLPQLVTLLVIVAALVVLSLVEELIAVRPFLRKTGAQGIGWFISTLAFGLILFNVAQKLYGEKAVETIPGIIGGKAITLGGVSIAPKNLVALVALVAITALLEVFYQRSWIGTAMRAVAEDRETASLRGIDAQRVSQLAFVLAAVVTAIAAFVVAPIVSSDISIGLVMGLKAFIALALGGFNSLRGCIVGGLLLGVGEYLVDVYGAANLQPLAGLGLLLLVLIVRPTGIFGVRAVREV